MLLYWVLFFSFFQGTQLFGKAVLDSLFQLAVGTFFCSVPVMWACYLAMVPAAGGKQ